MTGTIELDRDGHHLVIRFPYDQFLVEEVKKLSKRRWDRGDKSWKVPATHAEEVIDAFMKHGFEISGDVMGILAGTVEVAAKPEPKSKAKPADESEDDGPLSIERLNEKVREALREAFEGRVTLRGFVHGYDEIKDRKHLFFELLQPAPVSDKPTARVEVALFDRNKERLLIALEERGVELKDGLEVVAEARVDLHPAAGRFQLIVEELRLPQDDAGDGDADDSNADASGAVGSDSNGSDAGGSDSGADDE